jgi:hypothetical protein
MWTGQNSISQYLRLENSFLGKTKRHLRTECQHLTVPVPNSVGNRQEVLQKPGAKPWTEDQRSYRDQGHSSGKSWVIRV